MTYVYVTPVILFFQNSGEEHQELMSRVEFSLKQNYDRCVTWMPNESHKAPLPPKLPYVFWQAMQLFLTQCSLHITLCLLYITSENFMENNEGNMFSDSLTSVQTP